MLFKQFTTNYYCIYTHCSKEPGGTGSSILMSYLVKKCFLRATKKVSSVCCTQYSVRFYLSQMRFSLDSYTTRNIKAMPVCLCMLPFPFKASTIDICLRPGSTTPTVHLQQKSVSLDDRKGHRPNKYNNWRCHKYSIDKGNGACI